ncbi:hypothetical protein Q5P01_013075 [Channa striata]|uniref:Uncharacterized protein n=1 Tax=Channa striata TaxID=64152 RepID=A0AA88STT3_CHASR|nr:hypothetical protein Q5P01_013075 [Channa striata]
MVKPATVKMNLQPGAGKKDPSHGDEQSYAVDPVSLKKRARGDDAALKTPSVLRMMQLSRLRRPQVSMLDFLFVSPAVPRLAPAAKRLS